MVCRQRVVFMIRTINLMNSTRFCPLGDTAKWVLLEQPISVAEISKAIQRLAVSQYVSDSVYANARVRNMLIIIYKEYHQSFFFLMAQVGILTRQKWREIKYTIPKTRAQQFLDNKLKHCFHETVGFGRAAFFCGLMY